MSEKEFHILKDWQLVLSCENSINISAIMDCDGNKIYETMRHISIDESAMYIRGFEYGHKLGLERGESNNKAAIRKALGL